MVQAQQTPVNQTPNPNPMVDMMWGLIGQQFDKLPPAAKEALSQTEVHIGRQADRVIIKVVPIVENEGTEKMREILLNGFISSLPQMIEKSFHVKVKVYK